MLTSKQRSFLRSMGNPMEPLFQVGKGGLTDNVIQAVEDALLARELIKLRILPSLLQEPKEVAHELAEALGADVVQVIGKSFLIYKRNPEEPRIELPK